MKNSLNIKKPLFFALFGALLLPSISVFSAYIVGTMTNSSPLTILKVPSGKHSHVFLAGCLIDHVKGLKPTLSGEIPRPHIQFSSFGINSSYKFLKTRADICGGVVNKVSIINGITHTRANSPGFHCIAYSYQSGPSNANAAIQVKAVNFTSAKIDCDNF